MIGIIGKKIGMSSFFTADGISIPISIIKTEVNYITQIKTIEKDGYHAIQVTVGYKKRNRIKKPEIGHFSKAGIEVGCGLWEFRLSNNEEFSIGQSINIEIFSKLQKVDITGISKGKGFAGTIKRWNFRSQNASHGNSLSHRVPGSIGQNQTPGRVFKGKKMAGRMGNTQVTVQNLKIIHIDTRKKILIVKGAVPGISGSNLIIRPAVKLKGLQKWN